MDKTACDQTCSILSQKEIQLARSLSLFSWDCMSHLSDSWLEIGIREVMLLSKTHTKAGSTRKNEKQNKVWEGIQILFFMKVTGFFFLSIDKD